MESISALYQAYRDDVYRYLLGITRDPGLSEDLLSETFCAALSGLAGFRGEGTAKAWLLSIARNKWYDHLRRRGKVTEERLMDLYISDTAPGPEALVLRKEAARRAMELLEKEEPRAREIVKLRLEGYAFAEIGRKLGIREGSARVVDFRTRKKIKERLLREGYDESF